MPLNLFNSWSQGASSGLYHDDQQCQLEACYLDDKFVASQPKGFPNKPAILTCIEKSQEKYQPPPKYQQLMLQIDIDTDIDIDIDIDITIYTYMCVC